MNLKTKLIIFVCITHFFCVVNVFADYDDYPSNELNYADCDTSTKMRGMYKVTKNTDWSFKEEKRLGRDVQIETGITLTINLNDQTLKVLTNSNHTFVGIPGLSENFVYFLVEPGGKLIIKNGTIEGCNSDYFWGGIIVKGDRNSNQSPLYQGTVILSNCVIKGAKDAFKYGMDGYHENEGIINANNVTFQNCWRAAEFLSYQTTDLVSYFKKCNFIIDADYPTQYYSPRATSQITMWQVNGVGIYGCNFTNTLILLYGLNFFDFSSFCLL